MPGVHQDTPDPKRPSGDLPSRYEGGIMCCWKTFFIITLLTFAFVDTAYAEIFSWEDKNGVHFVDDISKVPKQYRKNSSKTNIDTVETASAPPTVTEIDPEVTLKVTRICHDEARKKSPSFGHYLPFSDGIKVVKVGSSYHAKGEFFWTKYGPLNEIAKSIPFDCEFNEQLKLLNVTVKPMKSIFDM
jgi:hypothetical protein